MLQRYSTSIPSVTVDDSSIDDSEEILFGGYSMGIFVVPTGSSITEITWYVAEKPGGTYLALTDELGNAVVQTVSGGNAYQLPTALCGANAIKAYVSAGTADTVISLVLKG